MQENVITADLHTHLLEKKIKPEKYWQGVKNAGLNAVAITEHAEYNPRKAFEKVWEKKPEEVMLIAGMEMFTSLGHVLAFSHSPEIYEIPELQKKGVKMQTAVELAEKNNILLSFAHPWGFDYDSVAYVGGVSQLRRFAVHGSVGVEVYTGMIGELAESVLKSKWVKRPISFFSFFEKNKVSSKAGIGKLMGAVRKKLDKTSFNLVQRSLNAMEFGEEARFITAGSDAHSAGRIGCGVIKLKMPGNNINERKFLEALQNKENVLWAGPPAVEIKDGVFAHKRGGVKKIEVLQGLKYVARKVISRKRPKKAL